MKPLKVAMFSPLPPKQTGIAIYTKSLVAALHEKMAIDLFDFNISSNTLMDIQVYDFLKDKNSFRKLNHYDVLLYHLGNNTEFHLPIYRTFLKKPGIVVLHDAVVFYLITGQQMWTYTKDFITNYGLRNLRNLLAVKRSSPEKYPLLKTITKRAPTIIVHSETAKKIVEAQGYRGKIYVIPLLVFSELFNMKFSDEGRFAVRSQLNIPTDKIIIGCFGFVWSGKRISRTLQVLSRLQNRLPFQLLLVGKCDSLCEEIKKYNLEDKTIMTGYVSDADFFKYMDLCDIIVNLRYPTMGETSGVLIQAMALGKACIVSRNDWFSELPDDAVIKIPYDDNEIKCLTEAIVTLATDKTYRNAVGDKAKNYAHSVCHPYKVAEHYYHALSEAIS